MNDGEAILWVLIGAYLLDAFSRTKPVVREAQQRATDAGVRAYEMIHDDVAHRHHLPLQRIKKDELLRMTREMGFADPQMATAIILAESGGIPNALGDNGKSIGLFQIYIPAHPEVQADRLTEPYYNLWQAHRISKGGTYWKPWSTFKSGAYRRHL